MEINIAETLREQRKKHSVSQGELAEYLGVSYQAVSKWENGGAYPDITLLPEIARYFGITTDELFGCRDTAAAGGDFFDAVYTLLKMSVCSRYNGLLALESFAAGARHPVMKKGIGLCAAGTDPDVLRQVLENEAANYGYQNDAVTRCVVFGLSKIQAGLGTTPLRSALMSFVPLTLREQLDRRLSRTPEFDIGTFGKELYAQEALTQALEFMKDLTDQELQRLLKQCDLYVLALALTGAGGGVCRRAAGNLGGALRDELLLTMLHNRRFRSGGQSALDYISKCQEKIAALYNEQARQPGSE